MLVPAHDEAEVVSQVIPLRCYLASEQCLLHLTPGPGVAVRRQGPGDDLLFADPTITGHPAGVARFTLEDDAVMLAPTGQGGPVLLNGVKVESPAPLRTGDRIRFGYTTLIIQGVGDTAAPGSAHTIAIATVALQRRGLLEAEAERLAQWADVFEALAAAPDDEACAGVILDELLRASDGERGMLATGFPPRESAAHGFSAGEAERLLTWIGRNCAETALQTPTLREVLGEAGDKRCIVATHGEGDCRWCVVVECGGTVPVLETGHRVQRLLGSLVMLLGLLECKTQQQRYVSELTHTIQAYARPAEQQSLAVVSARMIYRSDAMHAICRTLARAAAAPSPVLILGEPGTGKQLAAEAIHAASLRKHRELVALNLVEFPETLIESQLFGHTARVFPGARDHRGVVETADGGTLFLDEIGEASLAIQAKLLRVLEYGVFWKIGGPRQQKTDLRIITATNRDLIERVQGGQFRQDLFDRISVIPITLPPLRERAEDIPVLAERFLAEFNQRMSKQVSITPSGFAFLREQRWPDNIRGLKHFVERVIALSDDRGRALSGSQLEAFLTPSRSRMQAPGPWEELERQLRTQGRHNQARILRELAQHAERRSKVEIGEKLGISRPVFRRELQHLIAFCLQQRATRDFFEARVTLRDEDWQAIDRQLSAAAGEHIP